MKALRKTVTIMELIMKMVIAFIKKNKFDEVMLVSEKRGAKYFGYFLITRTMAGSGEHRHFSIIKMQVPWPFQVHPY